MENNELEFVILEICEITNSSSLFLGKCTPGEGFASGKGNVLHGQGRFLGVVGTA